jgi:hypothetical protein
MSQQGQLTQLKRTARDGEPLSRSDATQALRQVLARAVVWGMIDVNPSPRHGEQRPFEGRRVHPGPQRT